MDGLNLGFSVQVLRLQMAERSLSHVLNLVKKNIFTAPVSL